MSDFFRKFANHAAAALGSPLAFIAAVLLVLLWAAAGPVFGFSDTWELVINTATTIITFLMVFLIQNTQNRDSKAIQLKLDELLRAVEAARTGMVDLEDLSDTELERLKTEFSQLREKEGPLAPAEEATAKAANQEQARRAGETNAKTEKPKTSKQ